MHSAWLVVVVTIVSTNQAVGHIIVEDNMKNIKQQLAYMWKHREAVLGLIILLVLLFSGLVLIEVIIDKALWEQNKLNRGYKTSRMKYVS